MKKKIYKLSPVGTVIRLLACLLDGFFISTQLGLVLLIEILTKNGYANEHKYFFTFLLIVFTIMPLTAIWCNISFQDIDSWIVRKFGHKIVHSSSNKQK